MKKILTYIGTHRWCRLLLVTAFLLGLPMLIPFARQMVFGPTIDDIPWCVWQEQARIAADPERYRQSWVIKVRGILQLDSGEFFRESVFQNDKLVPIHLELAHDHDVVVRRFALAHLNDATNRREKAVTPDPLPALRLRLDDPDAECRFYAASAVWRVTKDPAMKAAIMAMADCPDQQIRAQVAEMLFRMAETEPDLFEPLLKLSQDPDWRVRGWAARGMGHFGKRGLPTLRRALRDPADPSLAVVAAGCLGADGAELVPELLALDGSGPPWMRQLISEALFKIDPQRFPAPMKEKK